MHTEGTPDGPRGDPRLPRRGEGGRAGWRAGRAEGRADGRAGPDGRAGEHALGRKEGSAGERLGGDNGLSPTNRQLLLV